MSEVPKRGRGRPKGSKNKPGAAGISCPPQSRHHHSGDSTSPVLVPPVPSMHVPGSVPAVSTSSKATPKTLLLAPWQMRASLTLVSSQC
ncbi:hypothetical protein PAXRUDRAFT_825451 [Paxillus rubicundulus Ve08.2h10]|uniref:Uncharacterized protein n=1 Tax=Paxillus rubicundulus Ve08.2h10 TaxID=930991 RepID=A0A0D0EAX5_9AGAM|nr:hypothetical protein PAXRUDRAFT_825451 [Paxillus rubicundulus Ve08.2h10]